MIIEEDLCVGCPPEICRGGCQYARPVKIRVCDRCEYADDKLYIYNPDDGYEEELCLECVREAIADDNSDKADDDEFIDNIVDELETVECDDVPQDDYPDYEDWNDKN